ncbi:unnamed protein product [Camellia sinensis]
MYFLDSAYIIPIKFIQRNFLIAVKITFYVAFLETYFGSAFIIPIKLIQRNFPIAEKFAMCIVFVEMCIAFSEVKFIQ